MQFENSAATFRSLEAVIPGGVNSPFRGFGHVGPGPGDEPAGLVLKRAKGARVYDVDDNEYIDYIGAWGPMICGHACPEIAEATRGALGDGWVFGASTEYERDFAEAISRIYRGMQMVRFVNSGAEAVQAAVRLARAATGRPRIVKLAGCYHGHVESLDMADTPHDATRSGIAPGLLEHTLVAPYNDVPALEAILEQHGTQIAAVVMEPVPGSMGVIPPQEGYLQKVRRLTAKHDVLLIFDEVLTGFRVALGGAQERFGVTADITALGKILGGGFPAGAYGGRRDLMRFVAPLGPMYQAGTFCGNPISMRAGLATIEFLSKPHTYERLESLTLRLVNGLQSAAEAAGIPLQPQAVGSMFCTLFADEPVTNAADYARADHDRFARFFWGMLRRGHLLPPSQSDAAVVSLAHTEADIDATVAAAHQVLQQVVAPRRANQTAAPS